MKQTAYEILKGSLASWGIELVPSWRMAALPMAQHLKRIFESYAVDCVLDVGANIGQYQKFLRLEVGYEGRIVSYEPIAAHVERMRVRARDDEAWQIEHCALGRERGVIEVNVMEDDRFTSILKPTVSQLPNFVHKNVVARVEKAPMWTLDEAVSRLSPSPASVFLKLDTQGFDIAVAEGGANALKLVSGLQTEASVIPIYEGMPSYQEAINYFERAGFALSGMFPVSLDDKARLIEFDCVMVRSN